MRILFYCCFALCILVTGTNVIHSQVNFNPSSEIFFSDFETRLAISSWRGNYHPKSVAEDVFSLGEKIFSDPRLSKSGKISCASCHVPKIFFADNIQRAQGLSTLAFNTPSLIAIESRSWFFLGGRADSLPSACLEVFTAPTEHGLFLNQLSEKIRIYYPECASKKNYKYQETVTALQAVSDYLRAQPLPEARFDSFVQCAFLPSQSFSNPKKCGFSPSEMHGLKLFLGKAACVNCHNGPAFSNDSFHNTGTYSPKDLEAGNDRLHGVELVLKSPWNCRGLIWKNPKEGCKNLNSVRKNSTEDEGALHTPMLRAISKTAPYFHDGRYSTLHDVVDFYNNPPIAKHGISELAGLNLTDGEKSDLVHFLETL